ncbi:MAG: PKD domain-containing protein [Rikenellaceae bacterium]|nr:PKD domain-containing protein [Rikenellaceae bacterium]
MSRILNVRSFIALLFIIAVLILCISFTRSCQGNRTVNAWISSTDITLGESITYSDSTSRAQNWLWEFGNGDYSTDRTGSYRFPDEGRYQIRLRVDDNLEKLFLVRVRSADAQRAGSHLVFINAPETAIQGEYILFSAEGSDQDWRWEFGESGIIDSREKTAIYAYNNPGIYQVRLTTESTQYPIYHLIEIMPKYMEADSLDAMTLAGNDIKMKLQNIADGKPFNTNYNYILKTYMCGNPHVLVTVNNNRRNDFYSYCQGLRIAGLNNTIIDAVYVEPDEGRDDCIGQIIVLQRDKSVISLSGGQ